MQSELEVKYKWQRQGLEQQESILVTKDMLHTTSKVSTHAAKRSYVPCQYCGQVDHWSSACVQEEVCPMCKTKNNSSIYICPLLKNVKGREKDYRGYKSNDPSSCCAKVSHVLITNVVNVQVSPMIAPPTPTVGPMNNSIPRTYNLILDLHRLEVLLALSRQYQISVRFLWR